MNTGSSTRYSPQIGDEVDVDRGPKLGGGVDHGYFVTMVRLYGDGGTQVALCDLRGGHIGCPLYSVEPTGRRWTDEERLAIIGRLREMEAP